MQVVVIIIAIAIMIAFGYIGIKSAIYVFKTIKKMREEKKANKNIKQPTLKQIKKYNEKVAKENAAIENENKENTKNDK